jgi:hypothetical protein
VTISEMGELDVDDGGPHGGSGPDRGPRSVDPALSQERDLEVGHAPGCDRAAKLASGRPAPLVATRRPGRLRPARRAGARPGRPPDRRDRQGQVGRFRGGAAPAPSGPP